HTDLSPNSARLRDLYAGSDVFVMPSRSEPFGIAAVEALASGLPVVATAQGGLTDIVEDGVNGRLVRPGDGRDLACALEALLADEAGRRAMGAEGRRLAAERFDAARNGQRLLDLVKQRIDGARGREAAGGG
ncbi:MAG: glycosyltransferase, partial [Candidatus Dormibacteraeota bacterium]|nr:glycosyltransferase [Candidatus Dormibacteraeota bacterium]